MLAARGQLVWSQTCVRRSVQAEDFIVLRGWMFKVLTSSQVFHSSGPPSSSLKCRPVCQSLAAEDKGVQHGGHGGGNCMDTAEQTEDKKAVMLLC